jgi:transposase-like protein
MFISVAAAKCRWPATVIEAEQALEHFAQTWNDMYPTIAKSWREKGPHIATRFEFPAPIRTAISMTNAIESVNSVIRKLMRNRKIYPNADSAFKITSLAIQEASTTWTMPLPQWKAARNHFTILFDGRFPQ